MFKFLITTVLLLGFTHYADALVCYNGTGVYNDKTLSSGEFNNITCPESSTRCIKSTNGPTDATAATKGCATFDECPDGSNAYDNYCDYTVDSGHLDAVCCCAGDYCNSDSQMLGFWTIVLSIVLARAFFMDCKADRLVQHF